MEDRLIYVSRLARLPLLDAEGIGIGRVADVVLAPPGPTSPPRVVGFVASVQRRDIFVNANRVGEITGSGVRLHGGTVDLRRFHQRGGELLARRDLLDKPASGGLVSDLGLQPCPSEFREWEVTAVAIATGGLLRRRRNAKIVPWTEIRSLFQGSPEADQVAALRELHPADLARRVASMPLERRKALAAAMDDERLADLLEEMPEDEQRRLIEGLDIGRAAHVLEEMEADDAADLLGELPLAERNELLEAMEPEDAADLRRLLSYEANTAGGLMTPEALVMTADGTVAEALARMRDADLPAALAAHVFVVEPPTETPTGRYLGRVGFQHLLREPPSRPVGECMDPAPEPLTPDLAEAEVARRLAAYDVVALPVCDSAGRLVGAVTVDDVLDRVLPAGWRRAR